MTEIFFDLTTTRKKENDAARRIQKQVKRNNAKKDAPYYRALGYAKPGAGTARTLARDLLESLPANSEVAELVSTASPTNVKRSELMRSQIQDVADELGVDLDGVNVASEQILAQARQRLEWLDENGAVPIPLDEMETESSFGDIDY